MKTKTHIKVFITKNFKFRAIIQEESSIKYGVTIGGEMWKKGKGREYESIIKQKIVDIIADLHLKYIRYFE